MFKKITLGMAALLALSLAFVSCSDPEDTDDSAPFFVGNAYTFQTASGPHTLYFASDEQIVYRMETKTGTTYTHYLKYTAQSENDVWTLAVGEPGSEKSYTVKRAEDDAIYVNTGSGDTKAEKDEFAACYGTWNGTWSVMGSQNDMEVVVSKGTFVYTSEKMSGDYGFVTWSKQEDGTIVCSGAKEYGGAASATVSFTKSDSGKISAAFAVTKMAQMGASPCQLERKSYDIDVPAAE